MQKSKQYWTKNAYKQVQPKREIWLPVQNYIKAPCLASKFKNVLISESEHRDHCTGWYLMPILILKVPIIDYESIYFQKSKLGQKL